MLVVVGLSVAFFLGFQLLVARFEPKRRAISSTSNHAYYKSKYQHEIIEGFGLPDEHACHLAAFFLSWIINKRLTSLWFESSGRRELALYRAGKMSIRALYYQRCDGCLVSDMLSDEGNAFTKAYFDLLRGKYLHDYKEHLQKGLPSEFRVEYTPEDKHLIHGVIDYSLSVRPTQLQGGSHEHIESFTFLGGIRLWMRKPKLDSYIETCALCGKRFWIWSPCCHEILAPAPWNMIWTSSRSH